MTFQSTNRELLVAFKKKNPLSGKDMVFNEELEIGNTVHMEALWFVFYEFIQSELDEVMAH